MKQLLLCLFFQLSFSGYCISQQINYQPPVELTRCEGDTFILWNYRSINNKAKIRYDNNCVRYVEYNLPNWEEFIVTGTTVVRQINYLYPPVSSTYQNANVTLYVKATKSTTITISMTQRRDVVFEGGDCPPEMGSSYYTDVYTYFLTVPSKTPPKLIANKKLVQANGELVSLQVSGCDTPYWGVQVFTPYCSEQPIPDPFNGGGITFDDFNQPRTISNSQTYYVRCLDNSCYSDWSEPVHIEAVPTTNPCNDPDLDRVNKIKEDPSRLDNHVYHVETVICNKAGNPNCTRQKVFETLLMSKSYSVPISSDLPKIALLGSKNIFKDNTSPVQIGSCESVNLPSGMAIIINDFFYNSPSGVPFINEIVREATALNPIANPIGQYVDLPTYSVINYTKWGHIFYPGRVIRTVLDDCQSVKIVTNGIGETMLGNNSRGRDLANFNIEQGEKIMKNADQRVIDAFNNLPK